MYTALGKTFVDYNKISKVLEYIKEYIKIKS